MATHLRCVCRFPLAPVFIGLAMLARVFGAAEGTATAPLPGTRLLTGETDYVATSIRQWDNLLRREIESSRRDRAKFWQRDHSSPAAFNRSVQPNRDRLRTWIGAVNQRLPKPVLEVAGPIEQRGVIRDAPSHTVLAVRWPVLEGVYGEGLLLQPKGPARAQVVLLPDAGQLPEELAGIGGAVREKPLGARLAESGVRVIIPVLVDRGTLYSGDERLRIFTNQSHREWIYRPAAEVGRHVIGYEVEKVFAAIDALAASPGPSGPVGVIGYGEGGLVALYAAALDSRIEAAWVSGYFQPRERAWSEPLYRNVWKLLTEFGDAEIAALVATRTLVVEHSAGPDVPSPQPPEKAPGYARSAAPGQIVPPTFADVSAEWERTLALIGPEARSKFSFLHGAAGATVPFGTNGALQAFLAGLGVTGSAPGGRYEPGAATPVDPVARQRRTVRELEEHVQMLARMSEYAREEFFWSKLKPESSAAWAEAVKPFRRRFAADVIGEIPRSETPPDARTRQLPRYDNPRWRAYEVVLDVVPGVVTWGYLLLPKDLAPGERRPVVVCQHGAGGSPASAVAGPDQPGFSAYQAFGAKLADEGFVVFAPYNPNTLGGENFRQLHRKGNLVGRTVFSIITANHERVLAWLGQQPFVDAHRIGFYGLSYGGKTAVRVPALLEGYCLSICSGDFNDYVPKMTSTRYDKNGFAYTIAYETTEFNLANTFNYSEMAALIAPRPFMVEHGYKDRVAPLEWAAAEYSRVARLYHRLGIPQKTAIEYFDGPHMIHSRQTFEFLREHLHWRR
jgi:dienelactone hydrolase